MTYRDGVTVRCGDCVRLANGELGTVVFSVDTAEYSARFPARDWARLREGVMVETTDGVLLLLGSTTRGVLALRRRAGEPDAGAARAGHAGDARADLGGAMPA